MNFLSLRKEGLGVWDLHDAINGAQHVQIL